jgi:hypothetical protein
MSLSLEKNNEKVFMELLFLEKKDKDMHVISSRNGKDLQIFHCS